MNIQGTNFVQTMLSRDFETKRIEKKWKIYEWIELSVFDTKVKVSDILDLKNSEKRVALVEDFIKIIDKKLLSGEKITKILEYRFLEFFLQRLTEKEKMYIASWFASAEGNIFEEFRREYLKTVIFRNIRSWNYKHIKNFFEDYLEEYKQKKFDIDFLLSGAKTEEEKQIILNYLNKKN